VPIYEFACQSCGRPFEELVWSSAEIADVVCPECGGRDVVRKVSLFASIGGGRASTAGGAACAPGGG
jgi:putative FmdB family regulatory protein